MQLELLSSFLILLHFTQGAGHGFLTSPEPRGGPVEGVGTKRRPFDEAGDVANRVEGDDACGGKKAGKPKAVYKSGQQVTVKWSISIPHNRDRTKTGVRIALKYSDADGFADNVLAGGVPGQKGNYAPLDAGRTSNEETTVTLPSDKTCKSCTLQWIWAAQSDGGYYLYCADISIVSNTSTPAARRRRRRSSRRRSSRRRSSRRRRRRSSKQRRRRAKAGLQQVREE
mmetsp:Transcript_68505/g.126282  ORF Transcript_68505/g.126282 Transcript_68505/m.126282 type:complete len:227 (-) Transcript_68505:81-761(-)